LQPKSGEKPKSIRKIIILLAFIVFMNGVGSGIVFPILPLLGPVLGISPFFLSLTISGSSISKLAFNSAAGYIIDSWGTHKPLVLAMLIKSIAMAFLAFGIYSPILPGYIFFLARLLYGIGSSLIIIAVYALIFKLTNMDNRGSRTAYIRTAGLIGVPAGLVLGGIISDFFGYSMTFFLAAVLLFVFTLLSYVILTTEEAGQKTSRKEIWGIYMAIKISIKDTRIFKLSVANMLEFFIVGGVFLSTAVLYVKEYNFYFMGMGPGGISGIFLGMMVVSKVISTLFLAKIIDKSNTRSIFSIVGAILGFTSFLLWSYFPKPVMMLTGLLILGISSGITSSPLLTLLGDFSSPELRGRTMSIYNIFGDIGGILGPIFGVNMVESFGFKITYGIMAGLMVGLLLLALSIYNYEKNLIRIV